MFDNRTLKNDRGTSQCGSNLNTEGACVNYLFCTFSQNAASTTFGENAMLRHDRCGGYVAHMNRPQRIWSTPATPNASEASQKLFRLVSTAMAATAMPI